MSEAIVEVSTFTASVVVPVTGEDVTALSVKVPLQAVTNRSLFLHDNAVNGDGTNTFAGAMTLTGAWTFSGAAILKQPSFVVVDVAMTSGGGVAPDTGDITPEDGSLFLLASTVDFAQGGEVTLADPTDTTKARCLEMRRPGTTTGPLLIKANGATTILNFSDGQGDQYARLFWDPASTDWVVLMSVLS